MTEIALLVIPLLVINFILFSLYFFRKLSRWREKKKQEPAEPKKKEPKEKGTIWAIGTLILGVTIWFTGVILGFFIKILFGGDKD